MELINKNDENNELNIIENLNLDYYNAQNDEKDNDNFNDKMDSLLKQLDVQMDNVKKYSNLNLDLNNLDTKFLPYNNLNNLNNQNQFNNNFGTNLYNNNNNIIGTNNNNNDNLIGTSTNNNFIEINTNPNNGNLIEIKGNEKDKANSNQINNNTNSNRNNNINEEPNENNKKEINNQVIISEYNFGEEKANISNNNENTENNNDTFSNNNMKSMKIEGLQEMKGSLIKNSQNALNMIQEELKRKEELEKIEELKKKEEELKRREEELIRKEKENEERERRIKEEEIKRREEEIKRKEEEMKRKEEEKRRKEEDEEAEKDRYLLEEYDRLEKEEKEKKEEEERENERIKKERLMKEKKEREENERKRKEEEKKKELERIKKEEELRQEKELKEQIKKQKIEEEEDDEVKVMEVDDDEIEELEEEVSFHESQNAKTKIKQNITKANIPNSNNNNININNSKEIKNGILKNKADNNNKNNNNNNNNNKINLTNNKKETNNNTNLKNKSINNKFNNNKTSQNNNLKDSKLKQSQMKKSTISNNSSRKPKQKKEPEKDLQDFKELNASVQTFTKSEIYKKLNEEDRNKIIDYINGVETFDTNNPDLEGINSFPYINKLGQEEEALSKIIPNFEEKIIGKYSEEDLDEKINNTLSGKSVVFNMEEIKLISEILEIPNESHMDIIKLNYEKEKLKNMPKIDKAESFDVEKMEEKLFAKEEFLPECNCPFSKLENLQTFIYKYSVHENPNLMAKALKQFNNWRITLGDGNSFYRVIMFAIIENCIFESNVELLGMILNEMSCGKFLKIYKLKKIEYEKPLEILGCILLMIGNNMEEKAYEFFLKAYNLKNNNFDLLLIIYLKRVIYNFGEEYNKLLDQKKKSDDDELIENIRINLDEIDSLYIEPKVNLFYMISCLFDININLFMMSGDFVKQRIDIKKIVNESEERELPTFIFGYFFSNYHILYPPNIENDIFKNTLENDNPKITQLLFRLKDNKKCDICFKDTKHIVFLRRKFIVCQPCLFNYITYNILKERKINFIQDKCFGLEYYCRPIHLQDEFYIDDYEYIELIEQKNFLVEICSILRCGNCEKFKGDKNLDLNITFIKLKCGCIFCSECIENTIKELTGGLGYLLECEIPKHKSEFECACKKRYSYKDIQEFVENDEDLIEEAKKRMNDYIKRDCMICMKDLIHEEKIKKIKMRKDTFIPDHFMCKACYNKCFKQAKITDTTEEDGEEENEDETKDMPKDNGSEDSKPKNNKKLVKVDEQKVYCTICSAWHNYKDEGEGCGCLVY